MALRPGGVSETLLDGRIVAARYSSTCSHCQHPTEFDSLRKMQEHVDVCRGCMRLICLRCVGQPCVPFEKRAEMMEREYRIKARLAQSAWRCY